jgi:two-component system OmpR family response regulator
MSQPPPAKKVLVVDDEATVRFLLSRVLTHAGFAVDVATDGESALERIESSEPDLVVLDLMMPGIDGWGVLERLKADGSTLPVLVVSAHGDTNTENRAIAAGASGYMTKPFALKALVESCKGLIAGKI